jgi:hypothetical protein
VKDEDSDITEEIRALVGRVVTRILRPDEALTVQELIGALYRLSLRSTDSKTKVACEKAIRILAKKLH